MDALPEARFCVACGAALETGALPADTVASAGASPRRETDHLASEAKRGATSEERRTVTVLFADLSGYTAISERLDPEAVKALVGSVPGPSGRGGGACRRPGGQVHG